MTSSAQFARDGLFSCAGMVAVVTGGGTGLGLIMARALAGNGASVYILGRRLSKLQEAASSCAGLPGRVTPLECDVSSKASLEVAVEFIAKDSGYVNLLIANAGITGPTNENIKPPPPNTPDKWSLQDIQRELWDVDIDALSDVYKVNVVAANFTVVAFLDLLDKGNQKGNLKQTSQVIVTCSIAAFHRAFTTTGLGYLTSKAATVHLVKCLSAFLIQYKIRVNALCPGLFPSEMLEKFYPGRDLTAEGSFPKAILPIGRAGRPDEMAGTVLYMASEAGAYNSGSVQIVDGGRLGAIPGSTY